MINKCYESEKLDGLEAAIASTEPITSIIKIDVKDIDANTVAIAFADDLFPLTTLMASSGINKNDDIAQVLEIWNARHTPVNKPFNIEHIPSRIIGHITASRVVNDDMVVIADDTSEADLPTSIHILTDAVIYRHLKSREPELQAFAAKLIEEIKQGLWYVSMECLFTDFDYAYFGAASTSMPDEIVIRNEDTAFLTKHLRAYGGNGVYNNRRIGRVFKNMTYSGKGLVRNPANPDSIIFNTKQDELLVEVATQLEKNQMDNEKITKLEADLAAAQATIADLTAKQSDSQVEVLKAKNMAMSSKVGELETEKTALEAEVATLKTDKEALETLKVELSTKLTETQTALAEQITKNIAIARTTTLVDKGVEKAEAEKIVEKYSTLNDDLFAGIVDLVTATKVVVPEPVVEETIVEDAAGEVTADAANVTDGETEPDAALASQDETQEAAASALRSTLTAYFDERLNS